MPTRDEIATRAIEGNWTPGATDLPSFPEALAYLVERAGSQQKVADAMGVPRRTLRRWIAGENQPAKRRRSVVQEAAARLLDKGHQLPEERQAEVRDWKRVEIKGQAIISEFSSEARTVAFYIGTDAAHGLTGEPFEKMLDRYLEGTPDLMGPIVDSMRDEWYASLFSADEPDYGFVVETLTFR